MTAISYRNHLCMSLITYSKDHVSEDIIRKRALLFCIIINYCNCNQITNSNYIYSNNVVTVTISKTYTLIKWRMCICREREELN